MRPWCRKKSLTKSLCPAPSARPRARQSQCVCAAHRGGPRRRDWPLYARRLPESLVRAQLPRVVRSRAPRLGARVTPVAGGRGPDGTSCMWRRGSLGAVRAGLFPSFQGLELQVRTVAPVAPGEQLFVSYGPLASRSGRTSRQSELRERMGFTCACPACHTGGCAGVCADVPPVRGTWVSA